VGAGRPRRPRGGADPRTSRAGAPDASDRFTDADIREFVEPAVGSYRAGDEAAAIETFFRGVFGLGYRPLIDARLPAAFDDGVASAGAFFMQELPALQQWTFAEEDAARITQPVLGVVGEHTESTFPERMALLLSWLPNGERFELPNAGHLLHIENPEGMAEELDAFFRRHPVPGSPQ
jgi:pimeloyl-ACP methyl ester carboxylesterase